MLMPDPDGTFHSSDIPLDVSETLLEADSGGLFSVRVASSIAAESLQPNSVLGCEISIPGTTFTTTEELVHRPTASKCTPATSSS